jgi:hypothetical protein
LCKDAGNVGIGTTAPGYKFHVAAQGTTGGAADFIAVMQNKHNTAGDNVVAIGGGPGTTDSTTKLVSFGDGAGTITVGTITRSGAANVLYNTSSDRRLKEDIKQSDLGLQALMSLKVRDFNFPGDERMQGFVAQEVHEVYPYAVHVGGEDAARDPWGIDYGRLTPLLVRAIQQQQVEIDHLKRRLTR